MSNPSPRLLPRAERRRKIINDAALAFSNGGFEATSMDNLAQAAGVTKLILYRHFDSKEDLYRAVLEEVFQRLETEANHLLDRGISRGVLVAAFVAVARDNPAGFKLLWRHASREAQFAAYAEEIHNRGVAFARAYIAETVRPDYLPWAAATTVEFLVDATLNWLELGDPGLDEEFAEVTTSTIEAMVRLWAEKVPPESAPASTRARQIRGRRKSSAVDG